MKTIEEKTADLLVRWQAMRLKDPGNTPMSKPKLIPEKSSAPIGGDITERVGRVGVSDQFLKDYADLASKLDGFKKGGKNQNPNLMYLEPETITWVANLAVGKDKRFEAWWCIVPPIGIMISYFGDGARQRALDKADEIKELY